MSRELPLNDGVLSACFGHDQQPQTLYYTVVTRQRELGSMTASKVTKQHENIVHNASYETFEAEIGQL